MATDSSDLDDTTEKPVVHGAANQRLVEPPSDDVIAEIEEERERRLDPANRPEGAEIDNSDVTMPTVDAFKAEQGDAPVGTSDPGQAFRENPPSEDEIKEIEEERERRLADENRPEGATVDNTSAPAPNAEDD